MTSEALQNPYFVRLFCIWILTKHISTYNIVKNKSFDKIQIVWALKLKKRGGDHVDKKGGGADLLSPPPPLNPPLEKRVCNLSWSPMCKHCAMIRNLVSDMIWSLTVVIHLYFWEQ